MAHADETKDSTLDAATRPSALSALGRAELIALGASAVWAVLVAIYFVAFPADTEAQVDSLRFVLILLAVFLPIAVIFVGASAARSARVVQEESRRLQAAIDGLRQTYVADRQARGTGGMSPSVERKLDEIARSARQAEVALATFTTKRGSAAPAPAPAPAAAPAPTAEAEEQPALALGTTAEDMAAPLPTPDLIRALNFPDTENDEVGFAALRRALKDRQGKQLIQAAQDVLTLLSQDGIYMDDLAHDRARPETWRRFAKGERGRVVAGLGGVRDRSSLALTAGRMREDTIFRDAAHHFLRKFDNMLVEFEKTARDEDIAALGETRTARAFMLLGRVTGTFD